jgi:serine/threonine-protein kinase
METGTPGSVRSWSRSEEERVFLQQRVALFWKAIFLISLGTDVVELLVDPAAITRPVAFLDRGTTVFALLLWLVSRRGRRSWNEILAFEWVGLAVVVGLMVLAGRYGAADSIAHFAAQDPRVDPASLAVTKAGDAYFSIMLVLGGGLILVLRAALVPTPPRGTLVLTSLLGLPFVAVPFFVAPAPAGFPALRTAHFPWVGALTYSIWWVVVAAGATVVSHVVFGLRAEVRRARRLGQYTVEAKIGEGGWASSTARTTG